MGRRLAVGRATKEVWKKWGPDSKREPCVGDHVILTNAVPWCRGVFLSTRHQSHMTSPDSIASCVHVQEIKDITVRIIDV